HSIKDEAPLTAHFSQNIGNKMRQIEQIIPNKIAESSHSRSRNMTRCPHLFSEYLVFYSLLVIFGISSLLWSFPAALLYYFVPRRLGEPLGKFMIMAGFRYFVKVMTISGIIRCDLKDLDMLR